MPIVTYIGSIASAPYIKLNEVSRVLVRGVLLFDHNTAGISSAQFPLAFPNRFLIPIKMVWLDTSACPFACGCATDVNRWLIPLLTHHSLNGFSTNCSLLSLTSVLSVPNLVMMFSHTNLIICLPDIHTNGSTSIHFVK